MSLFRFSLESLPQTAQISSASVNLYTDPQIWRLSTQAVGVTSHLITASWNENTVTWNSFGSSYNPTVISRVNIPAASLRYQSWDVTNQARGWLNRSIANNGILFQIASNPNDGLAVFSTREEPDALRRPKLIVNFSIPRTVLSFKVSPKTIYKGKAVTIKGQLKKSSGAPVAGKYVIVKANGHRIKKIKTNSGGVFKFKHKPKKTTKYTAYYSGDTSFQATKSKAAKVIVKKKPKKKRRR